MMSTWNTPTCGSTVATCAPRFAKSAARIDAATVPIGRNGTGREGADLRADDLRRPLERGDEHAVAAVAMRPEPVALGGPVQTDRQDGPQGRAGAEEGIAHRVGLAPCERADRIDEPATWRERRFGRRRDRQLTRRQGADPFLRHPPQELRAPARRPQPTARRVDQHPVERADDRWARRVLRQEPLWSA